MKNKCKGQVRLCIALKIRHTERVAIGPARLGSTRPGKTCSRGGARTSERSAHGSTMEKKAHVRIARVALSISRSRRLLRAEDLNSISQSRAFRSLRQARAFVRDDQPGDSGRPRCKSKDSLRAAYGCSIGSHVFENTFQAHLRMLRSSDPQLPFGA